MFRVRDTMQESCLKRELMMRLANLRTRTLSGGPRHMEPRSSLHWTMRVGRMPSTLSLAGLRTSLAQCMAASSAMQ